MSLRAQSVSSCSSESSFDSLEAHDNIEGHDYQVRLLELVYRYEKKVRNSKSSLERILLCTFALMPLHANKHCRRIAGDNILSTGELMVIDKALAALGFWGPSQSSQLLSNVCHEGRQDDGARNQQAFELVLINKTDNS